MHVALDGRHHDPAILARDFVLVLLDERHQMGHRTLHHPRALDHLGQKHLAGRKQIPDRIHPIHQWPFDHLQRPVERQPRLLGILDDEVIDTLHERVLEPLRHRPRPPFEVSLLSDATVTLEARRHLQQALGRIRAPIEDDVFHHIAKFAIDFLVDRELTGVDNAHVHAGSDGMVQKHRMHRLAHRVVAAERERNVTHTAADQGIRNALLDLACRLDECQAVAVVLLDARRHGEDVGIEDNVLRG